MPKQHDFALRSPDGWMYMKRRVMPQLEAMGVSTTTINKLFTDNPRRFFAGK